MSDTIAPTTFCLIVCYLRKSEMLHVCMLRNSAEGMFSWDYFHHIYGQANFCFGPPTNQKIGKFHSKFLLLFFFCNSFLLSVEIWQILLQIFPPHVFSPSNRNRVTLTFPFKPFHSVFQPFKPFHLNLLIEIFQLKPFHSVSKLFKPLNHLNLFILYFPPFFPFTSHI